MKLEKFKEKNNKKIGIILFTITCVLLISGVILYRTFAIFETNDNLDLINGSVEDKGDIEFAFYIDGTISKKAPEKGSNYSLDTSSSYCKDVLNNTRISNVNWNEEKWGIELNNVSTTKTKCYLYFKEIYKEGILNGAIPDLGNGRLIPVEISTNEAPSGVSITGATTLGGKVRKADITTSWYSYREKRWANAVILKEGHTTEDYNVGDEIPENDIESYFVWIPRYKYRLFADIKNEYDTEIITKTSLKSTSELEIYSSGVKSIEIEFETKDAGITNSDVKGTYLTHPAFISFDSNGFWVGKFEAGTTLTDNYNTRNSEALQIKPNIYSWRRIQPANAFYTSYDYLRDLESHMIKNTEWGAVAYLASSLYGFCEESKCTAEIRFNNNSGHLTGYAASKEPTCGAIDINEECNKYEEVAQNTNGTYTYNYFDTRSQVASTTGNYSGVYDMSGGAWEYVMGVMQYSESSSEPASGRSGVNNHNSGFTGKYSCYNCNNGTETELTNGLPWPSSKYYDLYDYNGTTLAYLRGKLGDGTKEFGPFALVSYDYGTKIERRISSYYADTAAFVSSGAPWFMRGGNWSTGAESGIMAFISAYGNVDPWYGFRVVLTP